MQNKGFVKVFAVLLTLVCLFYLSFSFVTRHYDGKAAEIEQTQGEDAARVYLDSMANDTVYMGVWTLRECREMGIGLGLDLKGGMNVILEVSVPDVVRALADNSQDENFNKAIEQAAAETEAGNGQFIPQFVKAYKALAPESRLAELFATAQMQGKVKPTSTDSEVQAEIEARVQDAIDNSFNVLRTRIDRFGVVQPNIQALQGQQGRIMVELPGVKEPERVRKLLQGSANLEFYACYRATDVLPILSDVNRQLAEATAPVAALPSFEGAETAADSARIQAQADSIQQAAIMQNNPLFAMLDPTIAQYYGENGCIVGTALKRNMAAIDSLLATEAAQRVLPKDLRLFWGAKARDNKDMYYELYCIKTDRNGRAPLSGDVVTEAKDEFDQFGRPCVTMKMNEEGARLWAQLTGDNVGHPVAVVLDNCVYSSPNVQNAITGGSTEITGSFTVTETRDLANVLKSGKMPAPAKIVSEEIVGPTLGQESINQGMWSMVLAFVALMIYMIVMYGFIPGMVANCALLFNLFFTLGILTSFQAALTMSGIAGMVLTLGMAVDANVLIYERTKEELRAGKGLSLALKDGYGNAFSAIIDSNVTSILTGIILYNFGTGPIKGFATTYIIGIVISFFTAVFLTRVVYDTMISKGKWQNLTFTTGVSRKFLSAANYNFMGSYKRSFTLFGIIAALSIVLWGTRGFSKSIDFTGGRNYTIVFDKDVEPEEVNALLATEFDGQAKAIKTTDTSGEHIRISTNYRINESGTEVDSEIEEKLFNMLQNADLLSKDLTLDRFINRDDRAGGSIISSQKVGPSIASDIVKGAVISVILALIVIFVYILVRFRNVAFSLGAITALAIDTIFILGVFSACWGWMPFSLEIDQTFIGALLTCIGYSINDKVVVFDRIRENINLYPKRDRQQLFNQSLNSTLTRTINTSVSTFIVLLFIFVFGGASIKSFAFAMILGVVIGTLTSMFIAAPTAYLVMGRKIKEDGKE